MSDGDTVCIDAYHASLIDGASWHNVFPWKYNLHLGFRILLPFLFAN